MKQFIAKLTALSLTIALVGWIVFSMFLPEYYLPVMPALLLFFFVITLIIHAYQVKLAKKNIGKFARTNMLITFFKLVIYSVLAVVYVIRDKAHAIPFIACLLFLYLVFTFFEVSELSRLAKANNK
jgi:hypothetical protein